MQNRDVRVLLEAHGHRISSWTLRRIPRDLLPYTTTEGGHRRYSESDVEAYLHHLTRADSPEGPVPSYSG
jgi:hypothetical protein